MGTQFGVKQRKFGKKLYNMRGWRDTRAQANEKASKLRGNGLSVRITKTSRPKGYAIWSRSK